MINIVKLRQLLVNYKSHFPKHWEDEKYKWKAVKHFQDCWDIEAENFGEMFQKATEQTYNLLVSNHAYPRNMMINFAKADDAFVRQMFRNLYDESQTIAARVDSFQTAAEEMRVKYDDGTWRNHYQNTNAISTYLWLMYPDRYYIYKYEHIRDMSVELDSEYKPKKNGSINSMLGGFQLYDEVNQVICEDEELITMLKNAVDENCYSDPQLKIVTADIGFYLSRIFLKEQKEKREEENWFPKEYSPNIAVEEWLEMLHDRSVFTLSALQIMKRMKDYGGQATCTQLSIKYGGTPNFYNSASTALARRVAEKTGCKVMTKDNNSARWWPILYEGKHAGAKESGSYIWRLRSELSKALDMVDLTDISLYGENAPAIWKISHGTESTGIPDINKKIFMERNVVVVVHSATKAKATSKVSQGQNFTDAIKKGDYFYLCYGSSIQLLGQFIGTSAVENPEMMDGWYEREYRVIARTHNTAVYNGTKKWWTPNDNSTCVKVGESEYTLFENLILQPYFDMNVQDLFGADEPKSYWWLTANPKIWSFSDIKVGEEQSYTLYNENGNGNKRRIFQNFLDVKVGDIVIGYEANPVKKIVAIAEITQSQDGEHIYFSKKEGLSTPIEYSALRECTELAKMEFFVQPNGSLFKLTKGEFDFIMDMIREENPVKSENPSIRPYTKDDFLSQVFMTEERYDVLEALLRRKKNVILQGAPGVGKTFAAKKLAYAMMGKVDDSRIELVQFHQNYSYEDFVMGYRPDGSGFQLKEGVFYRFCQVAENHPDQEYFFIIDEINRGVFDDE